MTDVGDIDIFIKPSDMNLAKKHLEIILEADDDTFFLSRDYPSTHTNTTKYFCGNYIDPNLFIQIDMQSSYHWRGFTYFTYEDAILSQELKDNIKILNNQAANSVGAFKDLIYGKPIKTSRYEKGFCEDDLIKYFTSIGYDKFLLKYFLARIKSNKNYLRLFFCLWLKRFKFKKISNFLSYAYNFIIINSFFGNNSSKQVALYGPDGGGKSSIIEFISVSPLINEVFDEVNVRHTRPKIIPPLSFYLKIFNKKRRQEKIVPRSVIPVSKTKAIIHLLYYSIDYLLANLIHKSIFFSKKRTLYIYDRYFFEFAYQQTFAKLPLNLLYFFKFFSRDANHNIFIYADPKIITQRKKELHSKDIEDQIIKYKKVDKKFKLNTVFIDTTNMSTYKSAMHLISNLRS